jgi:hypothetical protein
LARILAGGHTAGSHTQWITPSRPNFTLGGIKLSDISHQSQRLLEYDENDDFVRLRLRQQSWQGVGKVHSTDELLGKTVASDVPTAVVHPLDESVDTPYCKLATAAEKDAKAKKMRAKREAAAAVKAAKKAAGKDELAERQKASKVYWC